MKEEALTTDFLEFYNLFPRKEARRAALKAFNAAKKRGILVVCMELSGYKRTTRVWTPGRYVHWYSRLGLDS